MPQDALPLFPLGVVLFPGAELPLHIFEERYKEMIGDVLRDEAEFGVIFASEKGMANIGCTAVVEQVLKRYPDGRMDILCRGRKRFEVLMLDQERSYLRANVVVIPDEDSGEASDLVRQRVLSGWVKLMMMEHGGMVEDMPSETRPYLSFYVARLIPDVEFRQQLLTLPGEKERMEALANYLPEFIEREKLIRHVRRVAPLNGHSKHTTEV